MRRSGRSPPRHDANEEGTGLLVEFITKYADLLPRTNRSGVETDTERIAMMTSALKKPGFDAMAPPLEAEMHLLLLEALTPELSLDDMLDKVLGHLAHRAGSLDDLVFGIGELVEWCSSFATLLPGDVILTGTPSGVGPLVDGDTVEVEVEGLGILRNTVTAA